MTFYKISTTLYLDKLTQCYKTIVIINTSPDGPLKKHVKSVSRNKLSPFEGDNFCSNKPSCYNVLYNLNGNNELLCIEEIVDLFNFLSLNGYIIDNTLSKIFNKNDKLNNNENFICMIKY